MHVRSIRMCSGNVYIYKYNRLHVSDSVQLASWLLGGWIRLILVPQARVTCHSQCLIEISSPHAFVNVLQLVGLADLDVEQGWPVLFILPWYAKMLLMWITDKGAEGVLTTRHPLAPCKWKWQYTWIHTAKERTCKCISNCIGSIIIHSQ